MATISITLALLSLICAAVALFFAFRAEAVVERAQARKAAEPKPKGVLVPGMGIFSKPPKKRKPKYHSDQDQWIIEQDQRRKRKS